MAELIDREAFLKRFTSEYRCKFTFGEAKILNVMFEELKKEPTTTEAEIRAKAIDELLSKMWLKLSVLKKSDMEYWAMLEDLSDQLKEE